MWLFFVNFKRNGIKDSFPAFRPVILTCLFTLGKSARLLDQNCSDVQTINSLGNLYTKLSRLGIDQINTLERMKGKGQQKIIVEKMNIEAGGKDAIGVYEGVGQMLKRTIKPM